MAKCTNQNKAAGCEYGQQGIKNAQKEMTQVTIWCFRFSIRLFCIPLQHG